MNFKCQGCGRVCDWETRMPVVDQDNAEYKSIANRFCDAPACIEAEAEAHGLPVARVLQWHPTAAIH